MPFDNLFGLKRISELPTYFLIGLVNLVYANHSRYPILSKTVGTMH